MKIAAIRLPVIDPMPPKTTMTRISIDLLKLNKSGWMTKKLHAYTRAGYACEHGTDDKGHRLIFGRVDAHCL